MAQIGRLDYTVMDSSGTAQNGVSVTVRKQAAQAAGGGGGTAGPGTVTITVTNPGGVVTGDTVAHFNAGGTAVSALTYGVSNVTATTIDINSGGAITWSDDDRLTPTGNLPVLYQEPVAGADVANNPITTGADGQAAAWVIGGFYDLHLSGASITTKLVPDIYVPAEFYRTNVFTEATAVGQIFDTTRSITTAGAKLLSLRNLTTEKFYVDKDGHLGATTFDGAVAVTTGGIAVTGASSITGALTGLTGLTVASGGASVTGGLTVVTGGATITAGGLTVSAGAVSLPSASIATAALQANIVTTAPTTTPGAITDTTVTVAPVAPTVVDRITTAPYNFSAGNVGALINVSVPYQVENGGSDETKIIVRLYMDTSAGSGLANSSTGWTQLCWGAFQFNESIRVAQVISFSWFEASVPINGIRFKITDERVDVSGTPTAVEYKGTFGNDGGTQRLARIQIIEFKK